VSKYSPRGILIDTNLLVVFLSVSFDPQCVGNGRAQAYSKSDVELIVSVIERFGKMIVTPHVMAETSNLLRKDFKGKKRDELMRHIYGIFCIESDGFQEHAVDRKTIKPYVFQRLGFTDSALAVATGHFPIFTADLNLHIAVGSSGGDSINFWHLKEVLES
jgi:predicted nucleic acid-binding protein